MNNLAQRLDHIAPARHGESALQQVARWRRQARDARRVAEGLQSLEAIRVMRDVATAYDRLAAYAEARLEALE